MSEGEEDVETTALDAGDGAAPVSDVKARWFGKLRPPPGIVFICQMVVIYVVIGVSLFNLTRGDDPHDAKLWIVLLSSCLGYMLPNPKLDAPSQPLRENNEFLRDPA